MVAPSCKQYKLIDHYKNPAVIFIDKKTYELPKNIYLSYSDLNGLTSNFIKIHNDSLIKIFVSKPTLISLYSEKYLIYPGERLYMNVEEDTDYPVLKVKNNEQRNKELRFFIDYGEYVFKNFNQKYNDSLKSFNDNSHSIDRILHDKHKINDFVKRYISKKNEIFFEFLDHQKFSKKFNEEVSSFVINELDYIGWLQRYIDNHKDTLKAYNQYENYYLSLLEEYSKIGDTNGMNNFGFIIQNHLENSLSMKLNRLNTKEDFLNVVSFIEKNYNTNIQEYLKALVLIEAIKKNMDISSSFYTYLKEKNEYTKYLRQIIKQKARIERVSKNKKKPLLLRDGRKTSSIEDILSKNKGKVILLDFWATWCAPCIEELPYLDSLCKDLINRGFVAVGISIDRETLKWQKWILKSTVGSAKENYLLINQKSPYTDQYNITAIPRYILIGKDGNIISADAPRPSDPALKKLVEENL